MAPAPRSYPRSGPRSGFQRRWHALALAALLGACHARTDDGGPLRAATDADARRVVEELVDSVRRADLRSVRARLCASPERGRAILALLDGWNAHDGTSAAGQAEPSWTASTPVFRVRLEGAAAAGARHELVVLAREGCVVDVVSGGPGSTANTPGAPEAERPLPPLPNSADAGADVSTEDELEL